MMADFDGGILLILSPPIINVPFSFFLLTKTFIFLNKRKAIHPLYISRKEERDRHDGKKK
jgi:hypothetical protein